MNNQIIDATHKVIRNETPRALLTSTRSIDELTRRLARNQDTQHDIAYAIHQYVAKEIAYDFTEERRYRYPIETLEDGMGTCFDKSLLALVLCRNLGIESKIVKMMNGIVPHTGVNVYVPEHFYMETTNDTVFGEYPYEFSYIEEMDDREVIQEFVNQRAHFDELEGKTREAHNTREVYTATRTMNQIDPHESKKLMLCFILGFVFMATYGDKLLGSVRENNPAEVYAVKNR